MRRRIITGLLALFLLAVVSGCGGGAGSGAPHAPAMDQGAADFEGGGGEEAGALPSERERDTGAPGDSHREEEGAPSRKEPETALIGEGRARAIALKHAGLTESGVSRLEVELEREKGRLVYEVEFLVDKREYEYEIDACSGEILSYECEVKRAAGGGDGGSRA